jgi:dephospho-CoA kinase
VITIGLTGGIGMGKSTSASMLAESGLPIIDTDAIARQLVEPGSPALAEVARVFGSDILDEEGRLRRDEMARRVFKSEAERQKLEAVLHPRIRNEWLYQVERLRAEKHAACVVVIPLLFETSAQRHFQATVCTACSAATQRNRLLARGWNPEHIEQRIRAQWPAEEKMRLSDYVIWTDGGLDVHREQLKRAAASLLSISAS